MNFKKFFESLNKENYLTDADKSEINDIFSDLLDEGFTFINKDQKGFGYHAHPGEITHILSNSLLDNNGQDEYSSSLI